MKRVPRHFGVLGGVAAFVAGGQAMAAVGLEFTGVGSAQTSATVTPGSNFAFSVKLTESLVTDQVSGMDYRIQASTSGVFEFLSRNSMAAGDNFNSPNGQTDGALQPAILNPNNGTDLGTSTSTGLALTGPATYEVADYSFELLPGAPAGIYTLSFSSPNGGTFPVSYSGAPPSYPTESFNTLGTYTVYVPEPASLSLLGIAGAGLCVRRRGR